MLYLPVQQLGDSAGGCCSPFLFSLNADSLTSRHNILLKYANDSLLGNSYSEFSDQEGLDDDLSRLATWSADHELVINKTRYVECLSSSKNTSSQLPFSFLNGEALSREHLSHCQVSLCISFPLWSTPLGLLKSTLSSQNALNYLLMFTGSNL